MRYTNAFTGKPTQPTESELYAALGSSATLWKDFVQSMANEEGVAGQEWKGICVKKYGWSLRLKQKSRNIVYLGPGQGCFMVGFVLGDRALKAAKAARLPRRVADALATAPQYPEGTGLRLLVQRAADLPAIRKIAAIKIAN